MTNGDNLCPLCDLKSRNCKNIEGENSIFITTEDLLTIVYKTHVLNT